MADPTHRKYAVRSGRPADCHDLETIARQLVEDRTWQAIFTSEEQSILLYAAMAYIRLQSRSGLDLEEAHLRMSAMLHAAADWQKGEA